MQYTAVVTAFDIDYITARHVYISVAHLYSHKIRVIFFKNPVKHTFKPCHIVRFEYVAVCSYTVALDSIFIGDR